VNYGLINNNNHTFVKLGKCFINVLHRMYVKYYTVKVFFVESNISDKTQHDVTLRRVRSTIVAIEKQ